MAPLLADEFFGSSWAGRGQVADLLGRTLRRFDLEYVGQWSERDSGFLFEERLTYDGGGELLRSWHIAMDGEGTMLGLEASQGGRMLIEQGLDGFTFRFDRLPQKGAPNVRTLRSKLRRQADGSVLAVGWTRWLNLVPTLRTKAVLRPR